MTKSIWKTLSTQLGKRFVQRAYNNWFSWPKEGFTWAEYLQWKSGRDKRAAGTRAR